MQLDGQFENSAALDSQLHLAFEPAMQIEAEKPARSFSYYRQAVSQNLDPAVFLPNRMRLFSYSFYMLLAFAAIAVVLFTETIWPVKLLCGLVIGFSTGLLGLLTHEISHGTVVKNKKARYLLSFFGMQPFYITPTFWTFSHNRLHHGKSQKLIDDPDAFPNMRIFKHSKFLQNAFPYLPGSGHKRSILYFGYWLSFNYLTAQMHFRFKNRIYATLNHRAVTLELIAQLSIAAAYIAAIVVLAGPTALLWAFVIPTLVQNYLVMSYISTNHNLSPLTSENNPLINSLTVTNHPILEMLHFNFGYHVEHHLFPTVNGKHVKKIHHELMTQFPDVYKIMPKWQAIKALYSSSRIYKNATTLVHPVTGKTTTTL